MPRKNADIEYQQLLSAVQAAAEEEARKDLKFIGDAPFAGLSQEKADKTREALVYYARNGAQRALAHLKLNNYLADKFLNP